MNPYQDTLWESVSNLKPKDSFRLRHWESSDQRPNSSTKTFWQLKVRGKYFTWLEMQKMEHFYNGLSVGELSALVDAPGSLSDLLWIDLLRAKRFHLTNHEGNLDQLEKRLQVMQLSRGQSPWTKNLLYTYRGTVRYQLLQQRVAIGKVKKFSGWVRNSSAVGSKKKSKGTGYEPETFGVIKDESFDYFPLLVTPQLDLTFPGLLGNNIGKYSQSEINLFLNLLKLKS